MQKKIAIVAGNGPSLREIDYERLPKEYDCFRCNQFYFEEEYYLGKRVDYAFFNAGFFFEQYYTAKELIFRGEYEISHLVCSFLNVPYEDHLGLSLQERFPYFFPDGINGYEFLSKLKAFDAFFKFNEIYKWQRITSTIYMCAVAVALGYEEIYLVGLDFYDHLKGSYAFNVKQPNLLMSIPSFANEVSHSSFHTKEFDLKALEFLSQHYLVRFFSLSPQSPLSKYFDLAPTRRGGGHFMLESKPQNYLCDVLLPSDDAYDKYYYPHSPIKENKLQEKALLKENIYFRIFSDLLRLPSDIKHYLKAKKES